MNESTSILPAIAAIGGVLGVALVLFAFMIQLRILKTLEKIRDHARQSRETDGFERSVR